MILEKASGNGRLVRGELKYGWIKRGRLTLVALFFCVRAISASISLMRSKTPMVNKSSGNDNRI